MDHMTIIYWLVLLCGAWGFALFQWAVIKGRPGKPTHAFKAVMLLMLGVVCIAGMNLISRHMWMAGDDGLITGLADHWLWPFRWYPTLVALLYFCIHHTRKALGKTDEP